MPASNGAARSLQEERRSEAVRVRGSRMTKTQAYLDGMQTQQGVRSSDTSMLIVQIRLGWTSAFFKDQLSVPTRFGSGGVPLSLRRTVLYWKLYIIAAEQEKSTKTKMKKKSENK